jgi:DNA-binding NarL/FixJ family response regulator
MERLQSATFDGRGMEGAERGDAIGVVVADDHPEFRQELRELVNEVAEFVVVGEAPDGASAVRLARELGPDVVLMDLHMPGMNGCEATTEIVKLDDAPSVIVLSASGVSSDMVEALIAGAAGYLLKGASAADIRAAINTALDGGAPLSREVAGALVRHVRERNVEKAIPELLPPMTEREAKILELLALGRGNNEIAEELFVSVATVKSCMVRLFEKLGVDSRAQAAVLAVRAGVV